VGGRLWAAARWDELPGHLTALMPAELDKGQPDGDWRAVMRRTGVCFGRSFRIMHARWPIPEGRSEQVSKAEE
jgi:hypothetical protein